MTLTDDQKRDRIDATAGILTDLGLPTLAARLRDVIDELLPEPTPAPAPAWSPVVGGWAEHSRYGRVLLLGHDPSNGFQQWQIRLPHRASMVWVRERELSAPVPRVWDRASDVPAHVVVTDKVGHPWGGLKLERHLHDHRGPFTEVIGGVW